MTAPGGIPPGGPGTAFARLIAAQLDGIAARLGDTATSAPPDAPDAAAAARPGDRVEWSVIAESLASRSVVSPDEARAATDGDAARAVVARLDAATQARTTDAAAPLADPTAPAPPALEPRTEPRVDANALRLALPVPPHAAPMRASHASGAASTTAVRGVAAVGAAARHEQRTGRARVSRWRVALLVVAMGAAAYALGVRGTVAMVTVIAVVTLVRRRSRRRR